MAETGFRGVHVRSLPTPNRKFQEDRVCAAPECGTKLSIYNRWDLCWQHEPVHSYTPRGKRKKRQVA